MLSPVTSLSECYGEPRAQTNARVRKFAAQNIIDVSAVVALSYVLSKIDRFTLVLLLLGIQGSDIYLHVRIILTVLPIIRNSPNVLL